MDVNYDISSDYVQQETGHGIIVLSIIRVFRTASPRSPRNFFFRCYLSSFSGPLLTPGDTWDEGGNPQETLSDTSGSKDPDRPSWFSAAEDTEEPF